MRIEATIINVIFDAGQGSVSISSREATVGEPFGTLPTPVRRGYRFCGWYLDGRAIKEDCTVEAERDLTLTARWEKIKTHSSGALRSMLRKQKTAIAILSIVAVLLVATLIFVNYIVSIYGIEDVFYTADNEKVVEQYYIRRRDGSYALYNKAGDRMPTNEEGYYIAQSGNQYEIDAETGEYKLYARVDYEGSETGALKTWLLLYPQIKQENVYSIEVKNDRGGYKIYRNESGIAVLEGREEMLASLDPDQYAMLCVSCGYTLSLAKLDLASAETPRLPDGSIDYTVYGLANEYDEQGNLVYSPAEFTITAADEEKLAADIFQPSTTSYTVTVGGLIPSDSGYYAKVEGRDAVYVLNTDLADTVLSPVEAIVAPVAVSPMEVTTFTEVYGFVLGTVDLSGYTWPGMSEEEIGDALSKMTINELVAFSYSSLLERSNTIYSSTPYLSDLELMKGYVVDDTKVSECLGNLYELTILECKKLGITPEALAEYQLDGSVHVLSYYTPHTMMNDEGKEETRLIKNTLLISPLTEQGTYYVASPLYDMIVEIEEYNFNFLNWDADGWYSNMPVQTDINYLKEWSMTINGRTFDFVLDNRLSYAFFYDGNGKPVMVNDAKGSLVWQNDQFAFRDSGNTVRRLHYVDFENGTFYRNADADIVYVISSGVELVVPLNTHRLIVCCKQYSGDAPFDPTMVNYTITETFVNDRGEEQTDRITSLDNFRQLYKTLYFLTLDGKVDEEEFRATHGVSSDEYLAAHGDEPTAIIRYRYEDMAAVMNQYYTTDEDGTAKKLYEENHTGEVVLRFYRYTERKSMMTLEVVEEYDSEGNPILDPARAEGKFYVLTSALEGLLQDADDFVNQQKVVFDK